jgi:hypothetical protein
MIKGTLSDTQLGHVMGIRDAKRVWDILKGVHQTDDRARVRSLLAEFIRFRLDTTIDDGASTLTRLQSEIGNLDSEAKPSDAIKTEALLAGLGPEYESTLAGLDASGTTGFEDVVAKLKKAEARLKTQGQSQGQNLARFTATGSSKRKGSCYHCGKEGHYKRECREFLAEQAEANKDNTDKSDAGTQGPRTKDDGHGKGHHTAAAANH